MPGGYTEYGGVSCFGPYRQTFAEPVTVTMTAMSHSATGSFQLFKLDDQEDTEWAAIAAEIGEAMLMDGITGVPVTFTTSMLGCFQLGRSSF